MHQLLMPGVIRDDNIDIDTADGVWLRRIRKVLLNKWFIQLKISHVMLEFLKKKVYSIGVDLGSGHLKMAQLGFDGRGLYLHAAGIEAKPDDVEAGSSAWQRWAAKTVRKMVNGGNFRGRNVVTALPSDDVFIDQIKVPKSASENLDAVVFSKVSKKFPFDAEGALVKHVAADGTSGNGFDVDVLVMAAEKKVVGRHIAIYEKAGLEIQGIGVWPLALTNSYVSFFGRRSSEAKTVVMLMDIGTNHTNVAICRHRNLLFARVIPIGFRQISQGELIQRLMSEIEACCRHFESTPGGIHIERLLFLSGRSADKNICESIAALAERMQIPAQIGDVLGAVKVPNNNELEIDRRGCRIDWATAFGLSLTDAKQV